MVDATSSSQPDAAVRAFVRRLHELTPRTFVTPAIVVANAMVFVAMLVAVGAEVLMTPSTGTLIAWGADYGPLTTGGQPWRLLSSNYVHIGILHIGMNMFVLWDAGRLVERLVGNAGYLVMYTLSGIGGSLVSLAWNPGVVSAGASGAVFGVFGCMLAVLIRLHGTMPRELLGKVGRDAVIFVGFNVVFGASQPAINNAAHLGGLAAGFLCGLVLALPLATGHGARRLPRVLLLAVLGAGALTAGALALPSSDAGVRIDRRLELGASELFYGVEVSRDEARDVGDALAAIGLTTTGAASMVIERGEVDTYVFSIVVRPEAETSREFDAGLRQIGAWLSAEVFDGKLVTVRLLDQELGELRTLEPVGASALEPPPE